MIQATQSKPRAPRNRTLTLTGPEQARLRERIVEVPADSAALPLDRLIDRTLLGDAFGILPRLPSESVDLVVADPPYNLSKDYNGTRFSRMSDGDYLEWLAGWLPQIERVLKPDGSFYLCCDWRTSPLVYLAARERFNVLNRITWEREKGRGAASNWKSCSEDIWFFSKCARYVFNADAVKLRRKVIAPYLDAQGAPKDWDAGEDGAFRMTSPSNLWSDITVPFWSMPENTEHPTQKPEKLVAKLILASSRPGDLVLDPFVGSGTTSVVARKLGRRYIGIEREERYACLAEKRLELAASQPAIQGYSDGVFWERNSKPQARRTVQDG